MSNQLLKNTVPIIYNGGAYGTYLEWCLISLMSDNEIVPPFTDTGSSHNYIGRHLHDIKGWNQYVASKDFCKFVRLHPKIEKDESIPNNLKLILSSVEKIICLYPCQDSILLNINNWFSKILKHWLPGGHRDNNAHEIDFFTEKIYQNWPVKKNVAMSDVSIWIQREFLSLYLLPSWYDQVGWYLPDHWSHKNCQYIFLNDLLLNFTKTIEQIQEFCNLQFCRSISDLVPVHKQFLLLQQNLGQDHLCQQIIQSTLNETDFSWSKLPLASEAWVQWELRNRGFEMKCDGLDIFPTNSVQLKELLYPV